MPGYKQVQKCCGGVIYDCDGRRWVVHTVQCRMSLMELAVEAYYQEDVMRISLDTETGGLDPQVNPLLQLTLWRPEGPTLDLRIRNANRMEVHPRALQANGLNPDEGLWPNEAAEALVKWWKDQGSPRFQVIGQNVGPFDIPFAKQLCKYGVDVPWAMMFDYHYMDTGVLAFALQEAGIMHFGKWSLTNICQVLGILYDPHICRSDAKAAWHAWHRMEAVLKFYHKYAIAGTATEVDLNMELRREVLPALDLRG